MSEFISFYKDGAYKFCIKSDDIKSLSLQRNLIIKEEGIRVTESMKRASYLDSINGYSERWRVKKYEWQNGGEDV